MSNFSFTVTLSSGKCQCVHNGLQFLSGDKTEIYALGLKERDIKDLLKLQTESQLKAYFSKLQRRRFFAFIYDKEKKLFYAFNDKFGYNQIFVSRERETLIISSEVSDVVGKSIDNSAVYEFLSFQSIVPPKTIFTDVEMVPLAQYLKVSLSDLKHIYKHYWQYETLFLPKANDYDQHVLDLRKAFYEGIVDEYVNPSGVALSGGIDSGGILGILRDYTEDPILSISFGPYGKASGDLQSSRLTAEKCTSRNVELYPSTGMFSSLIELNRNLEQPIAGDLLLSVSEIFKTAKTEKISRLYFGYGTQMLLGNLMPNQLWHKTRLVEAVAPRIFQKLIYKGVVKVKNLSSNVEELLLSDDWVKRFFHMQASLFTREKHIFKTIPPDFVQEVTDFLCPYIERDDLLLSDRFVMLFMNSWINYGQGRNAAALGDMHDMGVVLPFNTPKVAEVLFRTPDAFRKKNHWNKQLWRDAMRPYVPEHLYMRKGKSLTIPYNKILLPQASTIVPYLEGSDLLKEIIDFEQYKTTLNKLPEPGVSLLRLINLAIWYDQRFTPERIKQAEQVLGNITFSLD